MALYDDLYGTPAPAPAAAPAQRRVQPVVMPQPAASAPAPDPLVAAMQARNAGAAPVAAAPAAVVAAPMPRQANESPKAFDQRMAKAREEADKAQRDAEKAKFDAIKEAEKINQKKARSLEQMPDLISSAKSILQGTGVNEKGQPIRTPLPTQSYGGMALNALGGIIGKTPAGAAEADRLKVIGGAMVMAMPRMEGPQSDADVKLYREMAGRVGDETISIERRLASLNEVEKLYSKYNKNSGWKVVP
jgi:hypothetical protein